MRMLMSKCEPALRDIAVNVFTIGLRSKIAQILTHFSSEIFLRALNLSSSKRWFT